MQYSPTMTSPSQRLTALQGFSVAGHNRGSAPNRSQSLTVMDGVFEHNHDARLTCTEQFGRLQEARVRALTHGLRMH